jgi:NADH pyrophosphatase NudC (nudix superfamily)
MKPIEYAFCPKCGAPLPAGDTVPKACSTASCGFVFWNNPTPVVAALVERPDGVVLAHNKTWPEGMFGLITGFLEAGESPENAILREIGEELGLAASAPSLIGAYPFEQMNQLIVAYHVRTNTTDIQLGDELDAYKIIPADKLKPWPFGTGLAVRDWLAARG